jgi:hypothetical protein
LEADLRNGLVTALGGSQEKKIRIQDWSETLGGVDVFVPGVAILGSPPDSTGIETRVWSTDQVLYDMLKLAAMCQQGDLGIGYVVVAARKRDWAADLARGGAISQMSAPTTTPRTWSTTTPIKAEGDYWRKMVEKTPVKPAWVPARIATATVDAVEVPAVNDHEIRIISVWHIGDDKLRLDRHGAVSDRVA